MIDYATLRTDRYLVLCNRLQRRNDLKAIVAACGGTAVGDDALSDNIAADDWPLADYLLVELLSDLDEAEASLSKLAVYLANNRSHILLWTDLDLVETAFAALPTDRSHFIVDAHDIEAVPILAGISGQMSLDQFHDRSRDGEYQSLHRISDELADFARTLARIAEQEDGLPSSVRDKPVSFRPAPSLAFRPMDAGDPPPANDEAAKVRNLIKLRRLRDKHFDASLFADPAWDILLDLYAAKLEGRTVSVSSLCIAAAVPPTTALRWITTMTEHGALIREQDPNDARRVFIELSEESETRLRAYFADAATKSGAPI
jgi:DNA-binding MarR family transcriptional regulator